MALKHYLLEIRPSRMLGLLLWAVPIAFAAFVLWENWFSEWLLFNCEPPELTKQNWLVLIGTAAAISGWTVSAYITLRNSIKQHTINTLLQSRLSTTYMENARMINKSFFPPGALVNEPTDLAFLFDKENREALQAVDYVLNYFEFMSVGIRHGDLDKKMLEHTMRGILIRLYEKMGLYLKHMRGDDGVVVARPNQLEHLTWLYNSWKKKSRYEKITKWLRKPLILKDA